MAGNMPDLTAVLKMTTDGFRNTTLNDSIISNNTEYLNIDTHKVLITTLWGILTVIGAVGNITVVFTMCKHTKGPMSRSATKCYIINVALADLAFILMVVPITTAAYVSENWIYGDVMCKLTNYIIYVTLLSTCLTLTAMTIDRYFAIVHPIRSLQRRTPKSTIIICIVIWLASLAVCIPFMMFHEVQQVMMFALTTVCLAHWPPGWEKAASIMVVLITYVIPLFIIVVCYTLILKFLWCHRINQELNHKCDVTEPVMGDGTMVARRRRKVAKIVAAVVILFAVTWLPIHLFNLCFNLMSDFPLNQTMYNLKIFAHTLSYINSCVNPFVYTIMGDNFRKAFMESVCGKSSPSVTLHHGYSKRTGSILETRFNGE